MQCALDRPGINLTLLAARPTRGVFHVDGWGELNINEAARAVLDDPSKNRWAPAFRTLYLSERLEVAGAAPQEPIARHGTPTVTHEVGR